MNNKGQEIEVKFYVGDLKKVEARLRALGAGLQQPRTEEINLRFDTPNQDLESSFRTLRLRRDERIRLTYKGPGVTRDGVRARREIEFEVSDFDAARSFLQALGYRVSMIYEKFRTTYRLGEIEILLDEMPYGNFVEIEGPDAETIRHVGADLNLEWDAAVPSSYALLFENLRGRMSLPFRDLTFRNFIDLPVTAGQLGVRRADAAEGLGNM